MSERWRKIPAYPLLRIPAGYEASFGGQVRSPRKVLSQWPDKDGYPVVKVGGRPQRVAVLVQLAFAGPPQVCHLDDDRSNSRASNLLWRSKVENEQMKGENGKKYRDGMECVPPFPARTPGTAELH
jgi:hypothetical protein